MGMEIELCSNQPEWVRELGWFYGRIGRDNVCILFRRGKKQVISSDLQGVYYVEFKHDIAEKDVSLMENTEIMLREQLRQFIQNQVPLE